MVHRIIDEWPLDHCAALGLAQPTDRENLVTLDSLWRHPGYAPLKRIIKEVLETFTRCEKGSALDDMEP